ncbi:uncharacterized protein LOC132303994 isoform X2 [Cornus florida]|uniref:uncharacterized protein LOC132303994 isoform X2 n=1 Tax=Cornus florida TaxID=4283 RepID=UPI00289B693F|nr:uncharacterized protein LOC132303994 isoform X2 [Cornus florida]
MEMEIRHFSHKHGLTFTIHKESKFVKICKGCKMLLLDDFYNCENAMPTCNFDIHIRCASLRPTVKFELHQHPLVFLIKKHQIRFNECSVHGVCSGHELSFPYFRCVPCQIHIDLFNVPTLPPTFKHSNHKHSLTLTHSPIKDHSDDHDDSEYYCDVCEDRRLLKKPTYYCEECHYIAELSCAFKEILPLLEREWSNEEIVVLQEKLNALTVKFEVLIKDLDELKQILVTTKLVSCYVLGCITKNLSCTSIIRHMGCD